MGIMVWMLQLVTCFIIFVGQPSLSVDYSPPPTVLMGSFTLNKHHLVVIVTEYPVSTKINRNTTGYIVGMEGVSPLILDWLSHCYKFNYSILDINAPPRPLQTLEARGPNNPGIISYAVGGECDAIIAVIQPTPFRLRQLEFVHPWLYTPIAFIIPMPEVSQNNIHALIKPFHFWVWMALILAIASVIVTLSLLKRFLKKKV